MSPFPSLLRLPVAGLYPFPRLPPAPGPGLSTAPNITISSATVPHKVETRHTPPRHVLPPTPPPHPVDLR